VENIIVSSWLDYFLTTPMGWDGSPEPSSKELNGKMTTDYTDKNPEQNPCHP
jgi:hypothetical protein